jgi:hypothetical protein
VILPISENGWNFSNASFTKSTGAESCSANLLIELKGRVEEKRVVESEREWRCIGCWVG